MKFCVHADEKKLQVYEYPKEDEELDLKTFGVSSYKELEDYEFRIFNSESKAEEFVEKFNLTKKTLDTFPAPTLPALLYPTKFLVLAKMGIKLSTYRHYKKPWKPGAYFRFHNQKQFITCKLKSITETARGYKYEYTVL